MDFDWSPELLALQAEAQEVAAKAVATYGQFDDAWINGYSREFSRELGKRGWIGMTWPTEYGGGGRTMLERFLVTEALIEGGAPLAGSWVAHRPMGPTMVAYGTEEEKREFLPGGLARGNRWGLGAGRAGPGAGPGAPEK